MERMSQIISFPAGQIIDTHTPHKSFGFLSFNLSLKKKEKNLEKISRKTNRQKFMCIALELFCTRSSWVVAQSSQWNLRLKIFFWNGLNYMMLIAKALE
ncbi:unnamed protein product [Brassica oleracea]